MGGDPDQPRLKGCFLEVNMRTMVWPPMVTDQGGIAEIVGADATVITVVMAMMDLTAQPFFDSRLCLGELTFSAAPLIKSRVEEVLASLSALIELRDVRGKGEGTQLRIEIEFLDLETNEIRTTST